jgi:hypothetical protein
MNINEATKELAIRIVTNELADRVSPEIIHLLVGRVLVRLQHSSAIGYHSEKAWIRDALRREFWAIYSIESPEISSVFVTRQDIIVNESSKPRPPLNAEFVLHLLLKKEEQDAVIGDLLERYANKYKRLGKSRADIWFYTEVGRSLWPLAKRFAAKAIKIAVVGEWIRRMIH